MTQHAVECAKIIKEKYPEAKATIAIALGSGLGALVDEIENPINISYADLPGFPQHSVEGHGRHIILGTMHGVAVACLQGRAHYYEGTSYETMKTMVRTLRLLGAQTWFATNASGSLRPEVRPGSLVVIHDHINFQFNVPLVGKNDDDFGPRFIGMEDAYDPTLQEQLLACANELEIPLTKGIYIGVLGPSFETPAEIRAFRILGGEVVGMSTIPEVILARHCGMKVAVVSAITNMAAGMEAIQLSHDVTLAGAQKASEKLVQLVNAFVSQYDSHRIA